MRLQFTSQAEKRRTEKATENHNKDCVNCRGHLKTIETTKNSLTLLCISCGELFELFKGIVI